MDSASFGKILAQRNTVQFGSIAKRNTNRLMQMDKIQIPVKSESKFYNINICAHSNQKHHNFYTMLHCSQ